MFIWIAIDINSQLLSLRDKVKALEKKVCFVDSNLTLPLHVSLKIPSEVPEDLFEKVLSDLTLLLEKEESFQMETERLELHETIAWLKIKENPNLKALHAKMNHLFLECYQIPLHDYDKDFQFHVTLFLDHDMDKVKEAFLALLGTELPKSLEATRFVIGSSPTGKIGTYRVIREITIQPKA